MKVFRCRTLRLNGLVLASMIANTAIAAHRVPIPFPPTSLPQKVSAKRMREIYEQVKTPFKVGLVIKPKKGEKVDCPDVFRMDGKWYMVFVVNKDGIGYETHLAESDDLLHWKRLGKVLSFRKSGWDKRQADGGIELFDTTWGGADAWQPYHGRYWATYIGGAKKGYETDPLSMGLAWTRTPTKALPWHRYKNNPILSPSQPDARLFERGTIYKSQIIQDPERTTGYRFVMFYNGKQKGGDGHEAIGMAVSNDMLHWHRFGRKSVIYNAPKGRWSISGDPQITRIDGLWVMFYYGAFWKPEAFDTFAVSYDLMHWTKWKGPDLISPSKPYDRRFAHKPWVLKYKGIVYHFYCAVGNQGRGIALATSKRLSTLGH